LPILLSINERSELSFTYRFSPTRLGLQENLENSNCRIHTCGGESHKRSGPHYPLPHLMNDAADDFSKKKKKTFFLKEGA
jgi:hypothetical protein